MKVFFSALFSFMIVLVVDAQTTDGLVALYHFNDSTANDQIGGGSNGAIIGAPEFICGVDGLAMKLDGIDDNVLFVGTVNNFFENDDFSLSFFMSPLSNSGSQTIFSKKESCDDEGAFAVRYSPTANSVTVELSETPSKKVVLSTTLNTEICWQHITVVRASATVRLYLNGELVDDQTTLSRIDVSNDAIWTIADGACVGVTDNPYGGVLDEVRLYDRALNAKEVLGLFEPVAPDNIITSDTTVFLGNDVQIETGNTCANAVSWFPADNLSDAFITEPLISPDTTQVYYLTFSNDELTCVSTDSIRITVIDPADLDCGKVFLPNAFTPNSDGRNDTYGISNPYAVSDLVSFEIFDRWGGRVFMTTNPMEQWDGVFKGKSMNPGVLLYKVISRCNGEEIVDVGSLTIIR